MTSTNIQEISPQTLTTHHGKHQKFELRMAACCSRSDHAERQASMSRSFTKRYMDKEHFLLVTSGVTRDVGNYDDDGAGDVD